MRFRTRMLKLEGSRIFSLSAALLLVLMSILILFPRLSAATTYASPIETAHFPGINTIVVLFGGSPEAKLLKSHYENPDDYPNEVVMDEIEEIFDSESWIKIVEHSSLASQGGPTQNMLGVYLSLSAQKDTFEGKPVIVASLSVSFKRYLANGKPVEVPVDWQVTFPFVVTVDHADFSAKLKKGVNFLTHYLPTNLCLANKKRDQCDIKSSDYNPWNSK